MGLDSMIELIGAEKTQRDLGGVVSRLGNLTPVWPTETKVMEANEESVFAALGGRYVQTGAVRGSLTGEGPGAVRRVEGDRLEFGTSIYYARYLTEKIGPATPAGGMKRPPPSAVLKLEPEAAQLAARKMMDHVLGGTQ